MTKPFVVTILNQKLTLRCDGNEEFLKTVAGLVEGRIQEVLARSKSASGLTASVLVSLNLAEELLRLRAEREETLRGAAQRVRRIISLAGSDLDEAVNR